MGAGLEEGTVRRPGDPGPVHVAPDQGESFWLLGDLYTIKVRGEDTGGAFGLWGMVAAPGSGPPLHIHHAEAESFYVLSGEFEFTADGRTFHATEGSLVYVPKGTPHTFKNVGKEEARAVVFVAPAGFERFFEEAGELATNLGKPLTTPTDLGRLLEIARRHRCEILGP